MATVLAVVLAGVGGCAAPQAVTAAPSPAGERAYAHLAELARITDAAGGTRTTPSPGYDAAVDHVAAVLRAAGWDVSTPAYEAEGESHRNVVAQTRTGDASLRRFAATTVGPTAARPVAMMGPWPPPPPT